MKSFQQTSPRMRDMTTGDPIRLILTFAAPLFIGNIFQEIYTMVDTMVRLSKNCAEISAIEQRRWVGGGKGPLRVQSKPILKLF